MKKTVFTRCLIVLTLCMWSAISTAQSQDTLTPKFPAMSGDNLNGKSFHLPQDLPAQRTLLLIAFEREQQVTLDSWSHGLDLADSQIPWLELPIISSPYILASSFIESGMRRGIPNPNVRDRVITLYTDQEAFAKSMGFQFDKNKAYAAVVDRAGLNLGIVEGVYDEAKAKVLLDLLEVK